MAYTPKKRRRIHNIHCNSCGYTKEDAKIHGDHHLCSNATNAPWNIPSVPTRQQKIFLLLHGWQPFGRKKWFLSTEPLQPPVFGGLNNDYFEIPIINRIDEDGNISHFRCYDLTEAYKLQISKL